MDGQCRYSFQSTSFLTLLLCSLLLLPLGQGLNEGKLALASRSKKSGDLDLNPDRKSFGNEEKDEDNYYYEEDEDIKITKQIPANSNSKISKGGEKSSKINAATGGIKSIDIPNISKAIQIQLLAKPENTEKQKNPAQNVAQELDPKTMKSIADEVAEAILQEADTLFNSMTQPDVEGQGGQSSDSVPQTQPQYYFANDRKQGRSYAPNSNAYVGTVIGMAMGPLSA